MKTRTRHTTIIETGGRWLWAQHDRRFKTLAAALRADARDAAEVARSTGAKVITLREICPNTPTGAAIARALTA